MRKSNRPVGSLALRQNDAVPEKQRLSVTEDSPPWERARNAYEFYRRRWHDLLGLRSYWLPKQYGVDLWTKLVEGCEKRCFAPARFIKWAIHPYERPFRCPEPTSLLSTQRLNEYAKYARSICDQLASNYAREFECYKRSIVDALSHAEFEVEEGIRDRKDLARRSLLDLQITALYTERDFTPLGRCIFALWLFRKTRSDRALQVIRRFEESALYQFEGEAPAYMEVWAPQCGLNWPSGLSVSGSDQWFAAFAANRLRDAKASAGRS